MLEAVLQLVCTILKSAYELVSSQYVLHCASPYDCTAGYDVVLTTKPTPATEIASEPVSNSGSPPVLEVAPMSASSSETTSEQSAAVGTDALGSAIVSDITTTPPTMRKRLRPAAPAVINETGTAYVP